MAASEIAEICGVSLRTAYRDLNDLQFAELDEIKQWIISLGSEGYVVEPEKLKKMVKSDSKCTT
ncbi:MAG: hypothetical protein JRD05_12400 [Deltaproteobacteria bacterium]|nr:hypothetical protein [Deltaproteobacteria bacterium]